MKRITTDDGRILTPPKELKPLLKGAYTAFYKLLGHIRFFYVSDEIWNGKTSLVFKAGGEQLAAITLDDGAFNINIAEDNFRVIDESALNDIFEIIKKTASDNQLRPINQLTVDLDEYPNGIRCDLCQLHPLNNLNDLSGCENFRVMDHHCYYGVEDGWGEIGGEVNAAWICKGKQGCYTKSYACYGKKGFKNCFECGEYRDCGDCGVGHNPGECNLGITAEEVTCLIIPYCEVERLDWLKSKGAAT